PLSRGAAALRRRDARDHPQHAQGADGGQQEGDQRPSRCQRAATRRPVLEPGAVGCRGVSPQGKPVSREGSSKSKRRLAKTRRLFRSSRPQLGPAYPWGWLRCHCHAVRTISSRSVNRGFQPSSLWALAELATSTAGSPGLRSPSLTGILAPTTRSAASITCRTLNPLPLPKL